MVIDLVLANSESWRVEKRGGVVTFVMWKRPDLTRDQAAAKVRESVPVLLRLLDGAAHRALVFDLRAAPPTWGPITHKAFVDVISAWDVARRPVAVVAADEAIGRLSARSLVNEAAPRLGKLFTNIEDAFTHAC